MKASQLKNDISVGSIMNLVLDCAGLGTFRIPAIK